MVARHQMSREDTRLLAWGNNVVRIHARAVKAEKWGDVELMEREMREIIDRLAPVALVPQFVPLYVRMLLWSAEARRDYEPLRG